jgi:hypothetical protein
MQIKTTVLLTAIAAFTSTMPAYAYLDPGTGSLIVQSLIGGIAAASTLAGVYLARAKNVWNRLLGRETDEPRNEVQ